MILVVLKDSADEIDKSAGGEHRNGGAQEREGCDTATIVKERALQSIDMNYRRKSRNPWS